MNQTKTPGSSVENDNLLLATVSLTSINAETIVKLNEHVPNQDYLQVPDYSQEWEYRIGPGDVLSIVVWDHPQLTIPAGPQRTPQEAGNWVHPDGTIFYPYIGTLNVAGKTIREIREAISNGLLSVIPNPQVDVSIARFSAQTAQITGAVEVPGAVPITNIPLTLLDALAQRGGSLPQGDTENIKILRGVREYEVNLNRFLDSGERIYNPVLHENDIVVVPRLENNHIYVLGEVNTPTVIPIEYEKISLVDALASGEGLAKNSADASGIFVFRFSDIAQQIDVFQLDIRDPTALLLGTRFYLKAGDVVYATSAPAARWNRVISNLLPSLGALNTLLLIESRS